MLLEIKKNKTVRLKHNVLRQLSAWEQRYPKKAKHVKLEYKNVHTAL